MQRRRPMIPCPVAQTSLPGFNTPRGKDEFHEPLTFQSLDINRDSWNSSLRLERGGFINPQATTPGVPAPMPLRFGKSPWEGRVPRVPDFPIARHKEGLVELVPPIKRGRRSVPTAERRFVICCFADFQSAGLRLLERVGSKTRSAGWKLALQQIGNLRYAALREVDN